MRHREHEEMGFVSRAASYRARKAAIYFQMVRSRLDLVAGRFGRLTPQVGCRPFLTAVTLARDARSLDPKEPYCKFATKSTKTKAVTGGFRRGTRYERWRRPNE
jgi:hypothetical protein